MRDVSRHIDKCCIEIEKYIQNKKKDRIYNGNFFVIEILQLTIPSIGIPYTFWITECGDFTKHDEDFIKSCLYKLFPGTSTDEIELAMANKSHVFKLGEYVFEEEKDTYIKIDDILFRFNIYQLNIYDIIKKSPIIKCLSNKQDVNQDELRQAVDKWFVDQVDLSDCYIMPIKFSNPKKTYHISKESFRNLF